MRCYVEMVEGFVLITWTKGGLVQSELKTDLGLGEHQVSQEEGQIEKS